MGRSKDPAIKALWSLVTKGLETEGKKMKVVKSTNTLPMSHVLLGLETALESKTHVKSCKFVKILYKHMTKMVKELTKGPHKEKILKHCTATEFRDNDNPVSPTHALEKTRKKKKL